MDPNIVPPWNFRTLPIGHVGGVILQRYDDDGFEKRVGFGCRYLVGAGIDQSQHTTQLGGSFEAIELWVRTHTLEDLTQEQREKIDHLMRRRLKVRRPYHSLVEPMTLDLHRNTCSTNRFNTW